MNPNELRTVVYDAQLHLEAYRFAGIVQPFPNHFHAHYVLGLVEHGQRTLCCKTGSTTCARVIFCCSTPATATAARRPMACPQEVEAVCAFIRQHYAEHLTLEHLCRCAGLSKSTLLRAFVQAKGVTPYRYLEAVRIQKAQQFLFGIALCSPKKKVNKLTGSLPLLR